MNIEERRARVEKLILARMDSVGEMLEQFRNRIPSVLVDGPGWDRLLARARTLPVSLATSGFGFELRLHEREPRADLGLPVYGGSSSAAHFEEWCRSRPEDSSATALLRLQRELGRHKSALRRIAGTKLMLEYDVDPAGAGAFPDPGIFLAPAGDGGIREPGDLGAMADAVAVANGRQPNIAERRQAERLFLAMPPGARIGNVGAFPERPRALRLVVTDLGTTSELTSFLDRIDWAGRPAAVVPFVSDMEKRGAFASLAASFDVGPEGVRLPLGVSFFVGDMDWLKHIDPWMELIGGIRERNHAVPEKLSALAESWCGTEAVFGRCGMLLVVTGIHHIKIVLSHDGLEQVKAYVFLLVLPPLTTADGVER